MTSEYFPVHNYENYGVGANQNHMNTNAKRKDVVVNVNSKYLNSP